MDTKVTTMKQIRITRSGAGFVGMWEFDEDDAKVIFDALKEVFEPQA